MGRARAVGVAIIAATAAGLALPGASTAAPPLPLAQCGDFGGVHVCSGEVPSFDGSKLDVDLTFPATPGAKHPLIVMLHGFGNNKHEWESTTDQGDGADKYHWNNRWFAEHGYYVLNYTARGFRDDGPSASYQPNTPPGTSVDVAPSNPNDSGTIHVKSRDFEIRDTQWLAALVAANRPDVDPTSIAVTGGSYGGGESWLQASQPEWTFPNLQDPSLPVLQLQVAVPKYPWTDLSYALAPNGHGGGPSGTDLYESSQGQAGSDLGQGNPIGTAKSSFLEALFNVGLARGVFEQYGTVDTGPEGPISLPCWQTRIAGPPGSACAPPDDPAATPGDPYDVAGAEDSTVQRVRRGFTEFRSSYYQDELWASQVGRRKVAVFSIGGWTDDLFEAVESFRQFKYLKRLDPRWPVELMVADVGHSRAQNKPETWHRANNQAWQWLQSNITGSHDQTTTVTSEPTLCANSPQPASDVAAAMSLTATSPEALSSGALTIAFGHGGTTTEDSGSADPDGPATDPVVSGAVDTAVTGEACRQSTGSADPSGRYTAVSDPLPHHVTYVGLGFVQVPYRLTGTTATLHARVWDVPPGGGPTLLITRGTYRIDAPAYDRDAGVIRLPLFGNHWPLEPGHRIRLDLLQDEAPYLRRSNVPSTLSFDPPSLRLPTREAGELALSGP